MASVPSSVNTTWSVGGVDVDVASVLEAAQTTRGKLSILVVAPSIAVFLWFWVAYQTSPLRKYPGPFLAGMFCLRLPCGKITDI